MKRTIVATILGSLIPISCLGMQKGGHTKNHQVAVALMRQVAQDRARDRKVGAPLKTKSPEKYDPIDHHLVVKYDTIDRHIVARLNALIEKHSHSDDVKRYELIRSRLLSEIDAVEQVRILWWLQRNCIWAGWVSHAEEYRDKIMKLSQTYYASVDLVQACVDILHGYMRCGRPIKKMRVLADIIEHSAYATPFDRGYCRLAIASALLFEHREHPGHDRDVAEGMLIDIVHDFSTGKTDDDRWPARCAQSILKLYEVSGAAFPWPSNPYVHIQPPYGVPHDDHPLFGQY